MKNTILFLLFVTIPFLTMAQEQMGTAANIGLGKYKQLTLLHPSKTNPVTAADTANLQLGTPLQTAIVPLDKLKLYNTSQAAADLITNIDEFVYPVFVGQNKKPVGTMTLSKANGRWTASRFNAENQLVQDSVAYLISQPGVVYKLVKILPFHASFLSYTQSGSVFFIPLQQDRQREFSVGQAVKAEVVLGKYVKAANDYNGLPM